MSTINYITVLVAAIVQMILGFLWYGPIFGKPWIKMMGFTEEHMKAVKEKGMGGTYAIQAVGALLMAWVVAIFVTSGEAHYGIWTASFGIHIGLYLWVGLVAPITVGSVLWEGKSWKLWCLNAGYYLVGLCLMGAILGAWH